MKYILTFLLLTLFTSCLPETTQPPPAHGADGVFYIQSAYQGNGTNTFYVYTVDSCEYIGSQSLNANYSVLTHKGNCKFCLNRK